MWTRHAIIAASLLAVAQLASPARAQSISPLPLPSGGSASLDPTTGAITGGSVAAPISCQFNAVSGQLSGTNCNQLLVPGGVSLTNLERQVVNARVGLASSLSAEA